MKQNGIKSKFIITGLLVIVAGVLLYLFNAGILEPEYKSIVFSWQMLLVALGFNNLFSRRKWPLGIALMLIGGFFLLKKLDIASLFFITQNGWTILLIIIGLIILIYAIFGQTFFSNRIKRFKEKKERHSNNWNRHKGESGYINLNYVFSGADEKIITDAFKGGDINCVFGGSELDLSECQLVEGISNLEINTVFGGTVIYIPEYWNIEIRQNSIFGNFVDSRPKSGMEIDKSKTLIIEASSVFGGGEIKCKKQSAQV